jgi:hypothetical protein
VSLLATLMLMFALGHGPGRATEITQFEIERVEGRFGRTTQLRFELAPVVEDALLQGIPLFFVLRRTPTETAGTGPTNA